MKEKITTRRPKAIGNSVASLVDRALKHGVHPAEVCRCLTSVATHLCVETAPDSGTALMFLMRATLEAAEQAVARAESSRASNNETATETLPSRTTTIH